jgi:hypothetical protein
MRRNNLIALIVVAGLCLVIYLANRSSQSDNSSNEDQGTSLDRDGSVETAISVQHADSTHDIILTSHKVWIKNNEYTTITHRDTIPSLDSLTATAENNNGDTLPVRLKKDYQLFITVK